MDGAIGHKRASKLTPQNSGQRTFRGASRGNMLYSDGQEIRIGDLVVIDTQYRGTVVACVEDRTYLPPVSEDDLAYLKTGIMVDTDFGGLVHYPDAEAIENEGFELLARKAE